MVITATRTDSAGERVVTHAYDTVAPGVTNDLDQDFAVGSIWEVRSASGVVTDKYICTSAADGAATWLKLVNQEQGLQRRYIEETVSFAVAGQTKTLTAQLPAFAVPIMATGNVESALTLATAVRIGIGTSGDLDGYALSLSGVGVTAANSKINGAGALCGAMVASATDIVVTTTTNAGDSGTGSGTAGSIKVRVYYETPEQMANV